MRTLNLGNNESISRGIVVNADKTFTQSKDFKTIASIKVDRNESVSFDVLLEVLKDKAVKKCN
jgi:hypothetical protein